MAAPSKEELAVLEKFREAISDLVLNDKQRTDMALMAWLRARDLNITKAKEMLAKSLAYRKENNIDNVLDWSPPKNYAKDFPYEICGTTKDGSPILAVNFGKWDVRRAVEIGEHETWLRHIDRGFEEVRAKMEASNLIEVPDPDTPGKLVTISVTQTTLICDFDGYGMRQLTSVSSVQTILEFIRRYEANYPEILKVIYVINVPRIFSIFFSIIKPLLSPRTIAKLEIFTSKDKWKPAVLSNISPDQLPTYLGGTNTETCKFFTNAGETVDNNDDGPVTMTISAGHEFVLDLDITKSGTVLEWTFQTDSHNIGFSILCNSKEILPYTKVDSHSSKQEGSIVCKNTGTYTLIFDNKYSRLRSKTVHYTVLTRDP